MTVLGVRRQRDPMADLPCTCGVPAVDLVSAMAWRQFQGDGIPLGDERLQRATQ